MARLLDAIAAGDGEVRGLAFAGEEVAGEWLGHVDFEGCTFEDCDLSGCTLDRAPEQRNALDELLADEHRERLPPHGV